jgi:hypothetical protein
MILLYVLFVNPPQSLRLLLCLSSKFQGRVATSVLQVFLNPQAISQVVPHAILSAHSKPIHGLKLHMWTQDAKRFKTNPVSFKFLTIGFQLRLTRLHQTSARCSFTGNKYFWYINCYFRAKTLLPHGDFKQRRGGGSCRGTRNFSLLL